jgi:microcystin-dependent protein
MLRGTPGSHLGRSLAPLFALQDSMIGMVAPFAAIDEQPPPGWLYCNGQQVSVGRYHKLFRKLNPKRVSIQLPIGPGTPGVINTYPLNYPLYIGDGGYFYIGEGGGALPAPLALNTYYYIVGWTDSIHFTVSTTSGGAPINFSAVGSGSAYPHYFGFCPFGAGSQTAFPLPDLRSRVPAGWDSIGGAPAGRLTGAFAGGLDGTIFGAAGGEGYHNLTINEEPVHSHPFSHTHAAAGGGQFRTNTGGTTNLTTVAGSNNSLSGFTDQGSTSITGDQTGGSGTGQHNNAQPLTVSDYIIFSGVYLQ